MRNPKKIWEKSWKRTSGTTKWDKWGQVGVRGTSGTRRRGSSDLSGTSGTRRRGSSDLRGTSGTREKGLSTWTSPLVPKWDYKAMKKLITCVIVGLKECVGKRFSPRPSFARLFRHCWPLAASQVTHRQDLPVFLFFSCPFSCTCHSFDASLTFLGFDPLKNMQFGRAHQTVSSIDMSLLGFCGQFGRSLWRVLLQVKAPVKLKIKQFSLKILNTPLTKWALGSTLREVCWNKTPEQKGVNLEELAGLNSQPQDVCL